MRISDWSSDVCSSDLAEGRYRGGPAYYIEKAMGLKWYAMAFAVATIAAAGFLMPGVQANAIADSAANVCAGSSLCGAMDGQWLGLPARDGVKLGVGIGDALPLVQVGRTDVVWGTGVSV